MHLLCAEDAKWQILLQISEKDEFLKLPTSLTDEQMYIPQPGQQIQHCIDRVTI